MSEINKVTESPVSSPKWEFHFIPTRSELAEGFANSLPQAGRKDEEVFGGNPFIWIACLAMIAAVLFRIYVHADPHGRLKKSEVQESNALMIAAIAINVACFAMAFLRRVKRRKRELNNAKILRIDQDGVFDGSGKCLSRWPEISEFIEAETTYLLLKRAKDYVLVPKRIMDTEGQLNFSQHCRRKVSKNHMRKI